MAYSEDYLSRLKSCLIGLESTKVTERKKGAEDLTEFLSEAACIKILNENSSGASNSNEKIVNWDYVFECCHNANLKEMERYIEATQKGKDASREYNRLIVFKSLITNVPKLANRGEPKLKCEELVARILRMLSLKSKIFHDEYLRILLNNLLPEPVYWGEIGVDTWSDLLKRCIELYHEPSSSGKKTELLSAIGLIVKRGCEYSQFLLTIKNCLFVFLEDIISNKTYKKEYISTPDLQFVFLEVCLTVCRQLSPETRASTCKFGESIVPSILEVYEAKSQNSSPKKKILFELLLFIVNCHHPNGASETAEAAYAYQWLRWSNYLLKIWNTIVSEVINLQTNSYFYKSKKFVHRETFISLAVEVAKQVLNRDSNFVDITITPALDDTVVTQPGPAPKRRCLEIGLSVVLSQMRDTKNSLDLGPWLIILYELLSKYPTVIKANEFIPLLQLISDLLSSCNKESLVMDDLCCCCAALLNVHKTVNLGFADSETFKSLLNVIWETTLRTVGLNLSEKGSHCLLQSLLTEHHNSDKSAALLKIYESGVINLSMNSLSTLEKLIFVHQPVENSARLTLINYLLSRPISNSAKFQSTVEPELLVKVLIKLVTHLEIPESPSKKNGACSDIEQNYLLTSFQLGLLVESGNVLPVKLPSCNMKEVDQKLCSQLTNLLNEKRLLHSEVGWTMEAKDHILSLINEVLLYLHFHHYELTFNLKLLKNNYFEELLVELNKRVALYLEGENHENNVLCILKSMINMYDEFNGKNIKVSSKLFDDQYNMELVRNASKFAQAGKVTQNLLEDDFGWCESSCSKNFKALEPVSLFDQKLLKELDNLKFHSIKFLLLHLCSTKQIVSQNQAKLISELLFAVSEMDPHNIVDLQVMILALENVQKIPRLDDDDLEIILKMTQKILQIWIRNECVTKKLLSILGSFPKIIFNQPNDEIKTNFFILMKACDVYINKNIFGPSVNFEFISSIGNALEANAQICWTEGKGHDGDSTIPLPLRILYFLRNPYHQSRLCAAKFVVNLFMDSRFQEYHETAFDLLKTIINDIYIISGTLNDEQTLDEAVNRTAVVLHALAAILCRCDAWRKQALLLLLKITVSKSLNTVLVESVLKLVCQFLGTTVTAFLSNHFYYLVWNWFDEFKTVDNFPFKFLSCDSVPKFYNQFKIDIACLLFLNDNDIALESMATTLKNSVSTLLEESFSKLMAILLPLVADRTLIISPIKSREILNKLKANFNPSSDQFQNLMSTNVSEIILNFIRILEPRSSTLPPIYSFSIVTDFFDHLQRTCESTNLPLICYLCQETPQDVQKMLLLLTLDFYEMSTKSLKVLALKRYQIICEMLGQNSMHIGTIAHYVLNHIVHSLLHIMCNFDEDLVYIAMDTLQKFIVSTLPHCAKVISILLPSLASTLIPFVNLKTESGKIAQNLLESLLVTYAENLKDGIFMLDPFPKTEPFVEINAKYLEIRYRNSPMKSLENEINNFIKAGSINNLCASSRLQGLKHLYSLLASKKEELTLLYSELNELRGFSEDCSKSILHRLICMLIQLSTSQDSKIQLEAAKCLGELGAADLKTLTLLPEVTDSSEINVPAEHLLLRKSVQLLIKNLVDKNVYTVKAVSDTLHSIFCSDLFNAVLEKLTNIEKDFIHPFLNPQTQRKKSVKKLNTLSSFNENVFKNKFKTVQSSLTVNDDSNFHEWLMNLISAILDSLTDKSCYLIYLKSVCNLKISVAEELLPYICYLLLSSSFESSLELLNCYISDFFQSLYNFIINKSTANFKFIFLNYKAVKSLLEVVQFVRLQQKGPNQEILKLNYLQIAQGAQYCSAHFSSVFFAELWWNSLKSTTNWSSSFEQSLTSIEYICERNLEEGTILQNILRQAYTNLGDFDAVKGCGSHHLLEADSRVEYFSQTGQWHKLLETNDLQLSSSSNTNVKRDVINALKNCGLYNIASSFVASDEKSKSLNDALCEFSWRLSNWSVNVESDKNSYESWHYAALKSLNNSDASNVYLNLEEARLCTLKSLSHASLQSTKNIYPSLSKLQCLQEIEDVAVVLSTNDVQSSLMDIVHKWSSSFASKEQKTIDFEYLEPLLSQRAVILSMFKSNALPQLCFDIVKNARVDACHHVANRHLKLLSQSMDLNKSLKQQLNLEEAQLFWADNDFHVARIIMRNLLKELKSENEMTSFHSNALRIYGSWMAETSSESAQEIIKKYFTPALDVKPVDRESAKTRLAAHDCLACFADFQYQKIQRYIKSDLFKNKEKDLERQCKELEGLRGVNSRTSDVQRAIMLHCGENRIDTNEIRATYGEKESNLSIAMKSYLVSLSGGESGDMRVFRVVGLWLENIDNEQLMSFLPTALFSIPSYKFIPVLPQLIPRLSNRTDSKFSNILNKLIEKCALDHPHHTLPLVLAQANCYKDRDEEPQAPASHVLGARMIITRLKERATFSAFMKDMEKVCDAYISLANFPIDSKVRNSSFNIPRTEPITKIKNYTSVLCPTITLSVNKNRDYSNIIGIHSFESSFSTPGGVNAPKKINCTGTDGIKRIQLVKGQDDLKQDAVMQQVFSILNKLLCENKHTAERKLLIRTYKIVPMSQRSGVIEWCMNTQPLSTYLIGEDSKNGGAHKRYRPCDSLASDCRAIVMSYSKKTNEEKLKGFQKVCKMIQPVFRYFFLENFPSPGVWFERRTAYTHSVASSSMVGYILGLGDRHVLNILIDNFTAEVIHIDFGIAFEQGMNLPCPETIPFRLSRDIEDGMGVSGIEGVFRTCCEKTMAVLRANQEIILTTLEVLLYDPLYCWAMTPDQAASFQSTNRRAVNRSTDRNADATSSIQAEVNKTAERALIRVKLKLQGMEEEGIAKSIEGQVNRLIQQAKDPERLSRLFHGWQAYL